MDWMQKLIQHENEKHEAKQEKIPEGARVAKCTYCGKKVVSKDNLPFFEARPNMDYDTYYCGCFGWD